jgi:MMP 1-O-methyltransferase
MPSPLPRQPISFVPEDVREWMWRYKLSMLGRIEAQDMNVPGWFTMQEGFNLLELSEVLPPDSVIVETGSFCGKSSRFLLLGAIMSRSKLYCVDIFTGDMCGEGQGRDLVEELFQGDTLSVFRVTMSNLFPKYDYNKLNILKSKSIEQADKWIYGNVDLLFIDDDHTQCRQTVEAWLPNLAPTACIIFHDVSSQKTYGPDGPINTVTDLLREGWALMYGGPHTILWIISRDPEWWNTRVEATRDLYNIRSGLESGESGLSEGDSTVDLRTDIPIH